MSPQQPAATIPKVAAAARAAFACPAAEPDYWLVRQGAEIGPLRERVICSINSIDVIEAERSQHTEVYGQLGRGGTLVLRVSFVNLEYALTVATGIDHKEESTRAASPRPRRHPRA